MLNELVHPLKSTERSYKEQSTVTNARAKSSKVRTENCKLDRSALWEPWTAVSVQGKGRILGVRGG